MWCIPRPLLCLIGAGLCGSFFILYLISNEVRRASTDENTPILNDIVFNSLKLSCHTPTSSCVAWQLTAHDAFFNKEHKDLITFNQVCIEYRSCTIKAQRCQVNRENQSLFMDGGVKTVLSL